MVNETYSNNTSGEKCPYCYSNNLTKSAISYSSRGPVWNCTHCGTIAYGETTTVTSSGTSAYGNTILGKERNKK